MFLRPPGPIALTFRAWLAATLACLMAAGCATAPAPQQAASVPATPSAWAQPVPQGQAALAQWWRVFGDATLSALVQDALAANTDVEVASANLRQARAVREQTGAALLPAVSVGANVQRAESGLPSASSSAAVSVDASWEVDLFGARRSAQGSAQALERASAATLAATRVSVAGEVALGYIDLRGFQVREQVARASLASQSETLQITRWRVQAGLASAVEGEQAATAVAQTEAQIPALHSAAAQSAHALAVLTGRPPGALLAALASEPVLPVAEGGLAVAIPARTLRQRPDVLAAEERLRSAAELVAQADARRKPSLTLQASLAWTGLTLGTVGSAAAVQTLLASVAQPLFDGGALNAALAQRQAELYAAQANYRAQVLLALREVEDALATLSAARGRLASLERAGESAQSAQLLATQRHAAGLIDFQTVLETQRTLLAVQDGIASAQVDLASAHVRLYKALGGGWRPDLVESSS